MLEQFFKIFGILVFPLSVFVVAGITMERIVNRPPAMEKFRKELRPLNSRWLGYDRSAFLKFYEDLEDEGRKVERFFLTVDLIFPFFYGGALAISLLLAWSMLGRPFSPAWVFLPIVLAVAADWTENLIHLGVTSDFTNQGNYNPSAIWVGIASAATIGKLWLLVGSFLSLVGLCGWLILLAAKTKEPIL